MKRKPIKLKRMEITEFIENLKEQFEGGKIKYPKNLKLVNIRGCNGAGKSTVPIQMLMRDKAVFILTHKGKDRATVFPNFNFIAMGLYRTKTGGLDGYPNNATTLEILELLHKIPMNILMEGVISSTIFSTYAKLFTEIEKRNDPKRKVIIINLLPPLEVCFERIKKRSPEKFEKIKKDQVESKWRTIQKNAKKFQEVGLTSLLVDNSKVKLEETVDWFLNLVKGKGGVDEYGTSQGA